MTATSKLLNCKPRPLEEIGKKRIQCKECDGAGEVLRDNYYRPWAEGRWEQCEDCGGWGDVPVDGDEQDNSITKVA